MRNQKGLSSILLIVIVVALLSIIGGIYYLNSYNSKILPHITNVQEDTPAKPTERPMVTSSSQRDGINDWKSYEGKYFSFNYPQTWITDEPVVDQSEALGYSKVIEAVQSRISPNSVFEVVYRGYSYEENVKQFDDRKAQKLTVNGTEATKFIVDGGGHPLPQGYSIITIIVKGSNDSSYAINFNGDRKDIPDSLINQILSTFKFLN